MPRYEAATYWFGDIVFLRVREERVRGMVTGVNIRPNGITYSVDWPSGYASHYEFELTSEFIPDFGDGPEPEAKDQP